ncbi:MAG: hypothetical protein II857_01095 [Selenomonadaceae bacterium]|nr:hypothetical protein [Selenomonadaceae bacterium]
MAKYGYTAPWYFYWETIGNGGKYIKNDEYNFVMKKYKYGWDYVLDANRNHLTVSGSGAKITGTSKADEIYNGDGELNGGGDSVTINAGKGYDEITNWGGKKVSIVGGDGNDCICNTTFYIWNDDYTQIIETVKPDNATINGGAGNDYITNEGKSSKIVAGDDNDRIGNHSGEKVSILAGDGNDSIYNDGDKAVINAGKGADTINNGGEWYGSEWYASGEWYDVRWHDGGDSVTIDGGDGNDRINNGLWNGSRYIGGNHVSINAGGGDGNNSIFNDSEKVTILAGDGDDTIENHGSNVSINGGDGNNLISLTGGKDISIKGGKDTETFIIEAYNNLTASIQSGEGKNVIKFLGSWEGYGGNFLSVSGGVNEVSSIQTTNNTLITGAGDDSVTIGSDYNSIIAGIYDISAGGDADYILVNSGSNNTLDTGDGNDIVWIKDAATNNTINTGAQGDSIRSEGNSNSINAGYGNDTIDNWGKFVTIQAGDQKTTGGKNSVKNHVDEVTILGGNESDTIINYMGRGVSINGGAGKDVIKLYSTEGFGNILQSIFRPLLNAGKDFNQKKINNIIDMYNTLAEYIDGFEQISRVEATYKGKNQIEIRDHLKKFPTRRANSTKLWIRRKTALRQ